jgi:hypothetical protein
MSAFHKLCLILTITYEISALSTAYQLGKLRHRIGWLSLHRVNVRQ